MLDDLRQCRCAGLDHLSRDDVRVDDGDAEALQLLRHGRLARGDPAGQAYDCVCSDVRTDLLSCVRDIPNMYLDYLGVWNSECAEETSEDRSGACWELEIYGADTPAAYMRANTVSTPQARRKAQAKGE